MQNISKKELLSLPITDYATIRANVKNGDLVFCHGTSMFSKSIQWATDSPLSHVGIIYRNEELGRVLVLESTRAGGVHFVPLSYYAKRYDGKAVIAKINPSVSESQFKTIMDFGISELTRPYDYSEVWRISKRILFNTGRKKRDKKYICSELVYECYHQAGIEFPFDNKFISPVNIWKDERVEMGWRII
jgi:uncharacterized protein YycO